MMIYEQNVLDSTIQPIVATARNALSTRGSSHQQRRRSVNFSSCTKKGNQENEISQQHRHHQDQQQHQQAGVKRRSSSTRTSASVAIPNALYRSPSELQLTVDEQVADERDYNFYSRLVSGISERSARTAASFPQTTTSSCCISGGGGGIGYNCYNAETDRCLTHIMQTRQQKDGEVESGYHIGGIGGREQQQQDHGFPHHDWFTPSSCSSSTTSSSLSACYQREFDDIEQEQDDQGDIEGIFDLEL